MFTNYIISLTIFSQKKNTCSDAKQNSVSGEMISSIVTMRRDVERYVLRKFCHCLIVMEYTDTNLMV